MTRHDVVVIGASAGGVEALRLFVASLTPDFPAPILVVLHLPRTAPSALPAILGRRCDLPVHTAADGEPARPGHIYIAPPDQHLLLADGRLALSRGPAENGHRPAADPLFRSAAQAHGSRAIGVVLSGSRDDGAAGALSIARHGGQVVVQSPDEAIQPSMPRATLELVPSARTCPAAKLGPFLRDLIERRDEGRAGREPVVPVEQDGVEVRIASMEPASTAELVAHPAGLGCPTCGGSLFEIPGGALPRYRCRVGHAWSARILLDEQAEAVEGALWLALRALEDKVALCRRMSEGRAAAGVAHAAARYDAQAVAAERAGALIREMIASLDVHHGEPAGIDADDSRLRS
jgi:two-component system chemotaxis response regulator CheB